MTEVYDRYHLKKGETWYVSRLRNDSPFSVKMNISEDALKDKYSVTFSTGYSEAWELFCDLDDAFTLYKNDSITQKADEFYRQYIDGFQSETEAVYRAKNAVNFRADYADSTGYSEEYGAVYPSESHSITGFFQNGKIVCDGYAKIFQYLMIHSGMECVVVIGFTGDLPADGKYKTTHAWNKVKVNGGWLNMDVCWSDTGYPVLYDLKSDEFYRNQRHFAFNYTDL